MKDYKPNARLSAKSKSNNEFKGLYFFGEKIGNEIIPVYVGISRTVYRRLRQHGWGKQHNECTHAYLMANKKNKNEKNRAEFPDDLLEIERQKILSFNVFLYPVEQDYDLYFMEVALAGILKTKWNSFKTH